MQTQFPGPQIRSQSLSVLQLDVQQPGGTREGSDPSPATVEASAQVSLGSRSETLRSTTGVWETGVQPNAATDTATNAHRTNPSAFLLMFAPPLKEPHHPANEGGHVNQEKHGNWYQLSALRHWLHEAVPSFPLPLHSGHFPVPSHARHELSRSNWNQRRRMARIPVPWHFAHWP